MDNVAHDHRGLPAPGGAAPAESLPMPSQATVGHSFCEAIRRKAAERQAATPSGAAPNDAFLQGIPTFFKSSAFGMGSSPESEFMSSDTNERGMTRHDPKRDASERRMVLESMRTEFERSSDGTRKPVYGSAFLENVRTRVTASAYPPPPGHRKWELKFTPGVPQGREASLLDFKQKLDKLTAENFEDLSCELLRSRVKNRETLVAILDMLIDKALEVEESQELYARVCCEMEKWATEKWVPQFLDTHFFTEHDPNTPAGEGHYYDTSGAMSAQDGSWSGPFESRERAMEEGKRVTNFRRLLLNRLQMEFNRENMFVHLDEEEAREKAAVEAGHVSADDAVVSARARAIKRHDVKRRMLANICFIGHLYRVQDRQPIADKLSQIVQFCCAKLLNQGELDSIDSDSVECLCKLLTVCGQRLEAAEDAARPGLTEPANGGSKYTDTYFHLLAQIGRDERLAPRARALVQEVVALRQRRWARVVL